MDTPRSYDPRYLAGIVLFNRSDFFEAHEVSEDLWTLAPAPERTFYQSLIQAAVGLCHFCNGNLRGAVKLYHSSRDYMSRFGPHHLGLDTTAFWRQMEACFAELLRQPEPKERIEPNEDLIPTITLEPPPASWPDPAGYIHEADG